jgi:hypothetical protein
MGSPRPLIACGIVLGVVLQGLLSSCALPEVKPFTDATVQLHAAVDISGRVVVKEVQALDQGQAAAAVLAQSWEMRVKLLDALVDYARSLQAIVDAGKKGQENAEKLGAAIKTLGVATNLIVPGGGAAVGVATDIASSFYAQIATVLAARSLEEALDASQPGIEIIARHLSEDIADLEEILLDAVQEQMDAEEEKYQLELGFRLELEKQRKALSGAGIDLHAGNTTQIVEKLKTIDALLAITDRWYLPLQARLVALRQRRDTSRGLIVACQAGIEQWAASHTTLANTVRQRKIADVDELVQTAIDIREHIKKVRDL